MRSACSLAWKWSAMNAYPEAGRVGTAPRLERRLCRRNDSWGEASEGGRSPPPSFVVTPGRSMAAPAVAGRGGGPSPILRNVRLAAQSRRHGWSLLTHHRAYQDIVDRALTVLEAVGLQGKEGELAANLSHGEQRNLEIGIALATEPRLLCLDEPTAGMSAAETHDTMGLVRRIARDLTILIVEHDMQVVMELAQRITVLHYGEIL